MTEITEILVEIIEGSAEPVFASVPAVYLGKRFYKIAEHGRADYDTLKFNPGDYVCCLISKFDGKDDLMPVAYCQISETSVNYILGL